MKMKYIFGAALTAMLFTACSEDIMDRINTDEAHPGININAKLQLTDTEVSTVSQPFAAPMNGMSARIPNNSSALETAKCA